MEHIDSPFLGNFLLFFCLVCFKLLFKKNDFHKTVFFSGHSSSPWRFHCVPVMWDGIPAGGLQKSGVLHWQHWNWCRHELDHEPYGRRGCAEQLKVDCEKNKNLYVCSTQSSNRSFLWLAADFAAPLVLPGCSSGPGTTPTESLSEDHLATIVSMGFSRDQATKALRATVRIQFSFLVCQQERDDTHWADCVYVEFLGFKSIQLQR